MTIKTSTGLRNSMLDTAPFKTTMALCFLDLYAGPVPAAADDAPTGATKLCRVTLNSTATGLSWSAAAAAGVLAKAAEIWSGVNLATGVATFYRLVAAGDTAASSTTEKRVQGSIGLAGADMNLTNTSLTSGLTQTIDFFVVSLPTL